MAAFWTPPDEENLSLSQVTAAKSLVLADQRAERRTRAHSPEGIRDVYKTWAYLFPKVRTVNVLQADWGSKAYVNSN